MPACSGGKHHANHGKVSMDRCSVKRSEKKVNNLTLTVSCGNTQGRCSLDRACHNITTSR
jgi:hypothetical protein